MTTYINWSDERLREMIAKCTCEIDSIADNGKRELVLSLIRDMQDEINWRWNRVSDR